MNERRVTYWFGPLERRGLLGGLHTGQIVWLAAGSLFAVVVLDRAPSPGGVLAALAALSVAVGACFAPLGGRSFAEWAPVAWSFAVRRLRGRTRFLSRAATAGTLTRGLALRRPPRLHPPEPAAPPELAGVRIVEAAYHQRAIGALAEQGGHRLTAVLACRVLAFSLLDPDAQERRLARWGHVLSGLGGSAVRRIQWIERTAPAAGDELARWVHAERDPAVPLRGTPMIDSYLELIGTTTQASQAHEILIAVQVDARRARDRGERAACPDAGRGGRTGRQGTPGRRGHGPGRAGPGAARPGRSDRL